MTEDALLVAEAEGIDAIVEVTGAVEYGARVVLHAIEHGKHVILMNAELDGTLGPILKQRADQAGVIYTNSDGDQPGVMMNLYRFVKGIGVRPGPDRQHQGPPRPAPEPDDAGGVRAPVGPEAAHGDARSPTARRSRSSRRSSRTRPGCGWRSAACTAPTVEPGTTRRGGGDSSSTRRSCSRARDRRLRRRRLARARASSCSARTRNPIQQHYLNLYKLGEGPLYCFYTPYHLCHFEVPTTVARAVDFGDAALAPAGPIQVEVVATAKVDLEPGRRARRLRRLPLLRPGRERGRRGRRATAADGADGGGREGRPRRSRKDEVLTYDDVELPAGPAVRPPPGRAGRRRLL